MRVFSSNYALYGDMSARANSIYRAFSPRVEIYSIDESFLDVSDVVAHRREALARDLRSTVLAWTGLPTCVGVGPTKTLAKLANHVAKKNPELGGVCDLTDEDVRRRWMAAVGLEEVWGIGPASQAKLWAVGCRTVADVRDLDPRLARNGLTVVGQRIVHELRGEACLDLEAVAPTRKGCAVTRSFSRRVEDLVTMEQAVATHATLLGEKLRRGGLATDHVTVFFHTSEHDRTSPQRSASTVVTLPEATNDTLTLARAGDFGRAAGLASGLPLQQGRACHPRPRAASRKPARPAGLRRGGAGQVRGADGGARRLQRPLRARHGGAGLHRLRPAPGLVDEVRDALAALHDATR